MNRLDAERLSTFALVLVGTSALVIGDFEPGHMTRQGASLVFGLVVLCRIRSVGIVSGALPALFLVVTLLATGCARPPLHIDLIPHARIQHEAITECSGIVHHQGAFWVHNDSGDDPVLYRSLTPDFAEVEILPVPGAGARDWEDITAMGDDLIIGDIGDNRRERDDLVLYRVRYHPGERFGEGRLTLEGTYPFRYPDARHDAEALTVVDGRLVIVSKAREEGVTGVYRFNTLTDVTDLSAGARNVPQLIGMLDIGDGEQVTAATTDADADEVVLLTYSGILRYHASALSGPPMGITRLWARQCEGICTHAGGLMFSNEERDVFFIEDWRESMPRSLTPPIPGLPAPGPEPAPLPVENLDEGEHASWSTDGDTLVVEISINLVDEPYTIPAGELIGSSLMALHMGTSERRATDARDVHILIGLTSGGGARPARMRATLTSREFEPIDAVRVTRSTAGNRSRFRIRIPFDVLPGKAPWVPWRFDLHTDEMRAPGTELYLSGPGIYAGLRPFTWAEVAPRPRDR